MSTLDQSQVAGSTLGYAQITSNFTSTSTTPVQVTGLTTTVTIPAGGRRIKLTVSAGSINNNTTGDYVQVSIWDGTVNTGTQLAISAYQVYTTSAPVPFTRIVTATPAAGSKTYNVGINVLGGGTGVISCSATDPAFILVELI